jgi:hypothetical protein
MPTKMLEMAARERKLENQPQAQSVANLMLYSCARTLNLICCSRSLLSCGCSAFIEASYDKNTPPHLRLQEGQKPEFAQHLVSAGCLGARAV